MSKTPMVPPSLHEDFVTRQKRRDPTTHDLIDDDALDALAGAMRETREAAEKIEAAHKACMSDVTHTPAANAQRSRIHALAVAESAARRLDTARQRAADALAEITAATTAPEPPADELAVALEGAMRTRLAQLNRDERDKIIASAIAGGDDQTLGAVLRGPAWLVSMTPTEQQMRREAWRRKRFPHEADRADRIGKALEAVDRGGKLLVGFVDELTGSESARRAEQSASAATAALQPSEAS